VSGVILNIGRYGAGDYGVFSKEEEKGSESTPGGIMGNIRILRVITTFISSSPSSYRSKKIASLKITFFSDRISSY
jgi:hypothetical protein